MDPEIIAHQVLQGLVIPESEGKTRLDKRTTSTRRTTTLIKCGIVANALGSAMVQHGSTLVTCAITAELSPVLSQNLGDRGYFTVEITYNSATCYPFQRNDAATMQPSADERDTLWASEASSFLQRAVDLSGCLDLQSLVIADGEACWALTATCVVMQDDGGVLDACAAAIRYALQDSVLPTEVTLPDGTTQPWEAPEGHKKLLIAAPPSLVAVGFLFLARGGRRVFPSEAAEVVVIIDPTAAEAAVVDGCVTVATQDHRILTLSCHGGKPVAAEVVQHIAAFAVKNI